MHVLQNFKHFNYNGSAIFRAINCMPSMHNIKQFCSMFKCLMFYGNLLVRQTLRMYIWYLIVFLVKEVNNIKSNSWIKVLLLKGYVMFFLYKQEDQVVHCKLQVF